MCALPVARSVHRLLPDARRVLAKPFSPGEEILLTGPSRAALLLERVLAIPEADVRPLLARLLSSFSSRHRDFEELLEYHFRLVAHLVESTALLSAERRLLIGAYFTNEYSVEAAALFNPSLVLAPAQDDCGPGERRFVMSLRAVGEGHISSIEFRTGRIGASGEMIFDPTSPYLVSGQRTEPSRYDKGLFGAKLRELGVGNELALQVLAALADHFTHAELEASLASLEAGSRAAAIWFETVKIIRVLASSNYVTTFPASSSISERVIFPAGPNETRGMEDARFVRFVEDDGSARYYATYTAYDGFQIIPQLIETDDFRSFTISTLNGAAAQNKGMALFPRRIGGKYVMLSRKDRENLHIGTSTNVRFWDDVTELYRPSNPWELLQIGNCGSPIETEAGWLVITHGAGPMRQYALGALLLDLEDPRKIIGCLRQPFLVADESEREGYVPNVVYTCGGMLHGENLLLPYGIADSAIAVATISLSSLLSELRSSHASASP
jgi:predicted GH43/DUF377 family glycosyl hydrolase